MDFLLKYWPLFQFAGLALLAALMFWIDLRSAKRAESAVDPVKADLRALDSRFAAQVAGLDKQISAVAARVDEAEGDIEGLPTKADLANVLSEARAAHNEASAANAGIRRIENFFLERGVKG